MRVLLLSFCSFFLPCRDYSKTWTLSSNLVTIHEHFDLSKWLATELIRKTEATIKWICLTFCHLSLPQPINLLPFSPTFLGFQKDRGFSCRPPRAWWHLLPHEPHSLMWLPTPLLLLSPTLQECLSSRWLFLFCFVCLFVCLFFKPATLSLMWGLL